MLCQKCNQNMATSHIHYVRNGIVKDMYLCNACATDYKKESVFDGDVFKMLSSFLNQNIGHFKETQKCDCCGTDFDAICKTGKVGCGNCYNVFESQLAPTIARIHGKSNHVGKKPEILESVSISETKADEPKINEKEKKIAELKLKMADAVAVEDFEKAAKIRDEIKSLEE